MGTQPPLYKGVEPPPQFSAHVYWGQTAVCIRIPRGRVGLSLGDIVLDGTAPNFRLMSVVVAKRLDGSKCHLV